MILLDTNVLIDAFDPSARLHAWASDLLGTGLSTLRSWEQKMREPSGAARMLIAIALKHPEVRQEAVA